MISVKANATAEYRTPSSTTASESVNIRRKTGITAMPPTVSTTPCTHESTSPCVAAMSARSKFFAPR